MKCKILTFDELREAKKYYNEVSYNGFLINLLNSYKNGFITKEQKDELLD